MPANKNLRVALYLPSLVGGGAERVMLNLGEGLVELGCTVDLVLVNAFGELLSQIPTGVRVTNLKAPRTSFSLLSLARYFRSARPDVVISAMGNSNVVLMIAKALSGSNVSTILTEHSVSAGTAVKLVDRIYRRLARVLYPRATAVVAVSSGVADDLRAAIGIDRRLISVIYNPVLSSGYWEKVRAPLSHPWFAPGQPPVILGVGRLVDEKDFPVLIRALFTIRQTMDVRLLILGEGPNRAQLEELVRDLRLSESVLLPGFADNPYAYMAAASVFALSSRSEGLPTVLIEAIASGTQVVSTDCKSGPREILEITKVGELVPVNDPQAMATAIMHALTAPNAKSLLDQANWSVFTPIVAAANYLELAEE